MDNLTRSDKLFYAGIGMMTLSILLLVVLLVIWHFRVRKLDLQLDEEYGKDLNSDKNVNQE